MSKNPLKALAPLSIIAVLLAAGPALGGTKNFGIGILAGEPTGVSMKKWLGPLSAIDAGFAWSFVNDDSFQFHADYLLHILESTPKTQYKGKSMFAYGAGVRVKFLEDDDEDTRVGIRLPLGLTYVSDANPIDLFVELAPILELVPETTIAVSGGAGIRFYLW